MSVLGVRFYFRTVGRGTLHCQRCGGDRAYRLCTGRRWIHLLRIPFFPLERVAEHVQCRRCGTRYRIEVLALPTTAQMQAALPAGWLAAATAMLSAGDQASGVARNRAIDVLRAAGLTDYDDAALTVDLAAAADPELDISVPLGTLARQLMMPAPEWFLADVVRIGLADGALSADERVAAQVIAAHLGMTAAQARGVISMTEESAAAG